MSGKWSKFRESGNLEMENELQPCDVADMVYPFVFCCTSTEGGNSHVKTCSDLKNSSTSRKY